MVLQDGDGVTIVNVDMGGGTIDVGSHSRILKATKETFEEAAAPHSTVIHFLISSFYSWVIKSSLGLIFAIYWSYMYS